MTSLADKLDAVFQAGVEPARAGKGDPSRAKAPGMLAHVTTSSGMVYEAAHGVMNADSGEPLGVDGIFYMASMTKAIVGAGVMQLVEQGKLSLDAPAADVLPELDQIQVLEGIAADGSPRLRTPKVRMTLRHMLTHTSGFGYPTWNKEILDYVNGLGLDLRGPNRSDLMQPLLFDPGERWNYSIAIDWVGLMAEAVTGKSLGTYLQESLLQPLGMTDTGFSVPAAKRARQISMHQRLDDGSLEARKPIPPGPAGDMERGGGGLFGTIGDYGQFVRMILNKGELNGQRVLKPETVAEMTRNNIGALRMGPAVSYVPALSNNFEFLPGTPKTWGLTFQIAMEDTPGMRSAGSLSWAGLTNCYYWIDPARDVAGVYASQMFPFVDPGSHGLFVEMEKAVYAGMNG